VDNNDITVADNPAKHRYEILVGGAVAGFAAYRTAPDKVVFTHTQVDPAYEGQGLGSKLAAGALDDAKGRSLGVVAQCPFIAAYIKRHPEYEALIVPL
jgi:uncharacterized protein